MTDHVFPEDTGTGASQGDYLDAAPFASYVEAAGLTDFVASGLIITYNDIVPSFDVSSGKAVVTSSSAIGAQDSETYDDGVAFVAEVDSRFELSLTDNDVNHVYLDVNLSSDDDITITTNTTGTAPSEPSLKIAEIDTSSDTVTEFNRDVPVSLSELSGQDHTSLTNVQSDQHHTKYTDSEAQTAVEGSVDAADLTGSSGSQGQFLKTDGTSASWANSGGGENVVATDSDLTTSGETTILAKGTKISTSTEGWEITFVDSNVWTTDYGSPFVQSNVVANGSYALKMPGGASHRLNTNSVSSSLSNVSDGDSFSVYMRQNADYAGPSYHFDNAGGSDELAIYLRTENNDVRFLTYDSSGSFITSTSMNFGPSKKTWYECEIVVYPSSSEAKAIVYDLQSNQIASTSKISTSGAASFSRVYVEGGASQGSAHIDDVDGVQSNNVKTPNTITLSSSDTTSGKIVRVINTEDALPVAPLTIDTENNETINGEPDTVITNSYEGLTLQSDGSDWYVISRMSGGNTQ